MGRDQRRLTVRVILLATLALSLSLSAGKTDAAALPGLGELTFQEKWVLERVAAGEVADLKEKFGPEDKGRQLRARFLEALLTDALPGFKAHRGGIYLAHAIVTEPLALEFAAVDHAIFFINCRFQDLVNCGGCYFKKSLTVKQSVFAGPANFYRLKVGVDAFFGDTIFEGPANFGGAFIEGQFTLSGARFTARDSEANFNGLSVGQSATFKNAAFAGHLDLTGARIGGEFNLAGARFQGKDRKALFSGLKVGQSASLLNAVFEGYVDFGGADISGEFFADQARFLSPEQKVSFNGLKVGPRASFDQTLFQGPVDFSLASVAGLLIFHQTKFENRDQRPNFFGLKVEQHAFFNETAFQGGVSLVGAQIKNLMLAGAPGAALTYPEVNLDGAQVDYSLIIGDLSLGSLQATRLTVKGPAILKNLQIAQRADLRDSSFYSLKMLNVSWPTQPDQLWLEGLTYQALSAGEGPQDWRKLVGWVNQSRFDTRNYSQLEAYFRHGGYQDRADEVHIQGNRRQNLEQWWRPDHLATLIFWDGLAGYGRRPGRTFWLSLLIVLVGTGFFDHKNFDPSFVGGWRWLLDGSRSKTAVVRFFLSLDEFLPGVDLGLARLWQMSSISFPTLLYYHFHKISGWILVPIGLAAIFSQFK
jgi:uncharacterized protein YjbI with pentapeptide repeats